MTNTKHRTLKHALLSIRWLNMFGYGISYGEVAFLETTLAEDEIQNQLTRSYCPTIAEPLVYVIFKLH